MLQAGFFRIDISPERGIQMAGFPDVIRRCTGVHDPLYATAACLSDGDTSLCILSLDLLWYHKKHIARIRRMIAEKTAIPFENILICCTHTHSGHLHASFAEFTPEQLAEMPSEEYISALDGRIAGCAVSAYEALCPAQLGEGSIRCGLESGIGGNRRDPVNGAVDPLLTALSFRREDGSVAGCVVRYSLHPSAMHEDNTLASADYVAWLREKLETAYPGCRVLFLLGTAGDQSNRHTRVYQGFAEPERMGNILGDAACQLLSGLTYADASLATAGNEIDLTLRSLPSEEVCLARCQATRTELARLKDAEVTGAELRKAEVEMFGADCLLGYVRQMATPAGAEKLRAELPAEVTVFRIGQTCLVGTQGELFVEFGLRLRAESPFPSTHMVTLAGGGLPGYVCSPAAYREGGYEVGSSLLSPEAGDQIVEEALRLLKTLS